MPTPQVVFQILPSLVVGGRNGWWCIWWSVSTVSGSRPCASVWSRRWARATKHGCRRRARHSTFWAKGLGERGRAAPTECAVSEYRPTVVHTHIIGLNYAYPLMLRYRTPARVHTVHSLASREMGVRVGAWVRTLAFRYRLGGVVPVAVADEVRASIQQLYGYPDPPLIPNGIPTDEYAPDPDRRVQWRQAHGIEPRATVLVHVGRFAPPKNHALLVEAFAQVHSDAPLYLLLVGGGELQDAVREQVAALGLQERVRFLGIRADVADILRASDVFVLSSRVEGNPMSVMEAMVAGLPVVSTAVGGVPELVRAGVTGLLVPSEDAEALTRAVQALVDDPVQRQAMGAAARRHAVAHFDIRHTVRGYEQLYERLLSGGQ
jgi:glycosyltransferase involved in cell wall biosynthesis